MSLPVTYDDWEKLIASLPVTKKINDYDTSVEYIITNLKKGMTNRDISHLLTEALSIHKNNKDLKND